MKRIIFITVLSVLHLLFAQDITNKLGYPGNYTITDSNDGQLFRVQYDGEIEIGNPTNGGTLYTWGVIKIAKGLLLGGPLYDYSINPGTNGQILSSTGTATDWIDAPIGSSGWGLSGNSGTTAGTNFLGTTDNIALEFKVNNQRVVRYQPSAIPNIIGGYSGNNITTGVVGAFIGGGGISGLENQVTANYGSVLGGADNTASGEASTAMGLGTTASGSRSTAMGLNTTASGKASIATGLNTIASGDYSTAMGDNTVASGHASVAMGEAIKASGDHTIAVALNYQNNTDVTQSNTMSIMGGNVGIGTIAPDFPLHIYSDLSHGSDYKWDHHIKLEVDNGWWTMGVDDESNDADFIFRSSEDSDGYTAYIDPTSGGWQITSDKRLKKNIQSIDHALKKIQKLEPITYHRIKQDDTELREIGFIAQDVNVLFPETKIAKQKGDYWTLTYDNFGPIAIAGIKELKAEKDKEIQELKNEIAGLKDIINELLLLKDQ